MGKVAHGVAAIYNPELAPPPIKPIEDKEPQVTARLKELLQEFIKGTADPNLFTKEAQATIFPDRAKRIGEFLKTLGTLNKIQLFERKDEDEIRVYRYQLVFQNSNLLFTLSLTKESKIAGLQIQPE